MVNKVFKCLRCEECCFFRDSRDSPVVYPWEKRVLEKYARSRGFELVFKPFLVYTKSNDAVVVLYKWIINGYCPFYDRNSRSCTIYEDRPFACRMYPLILGLKDNTLRLSTTCKWVLDNLGDKQIPIDPSKVFPYEYSVAVKNFVRLKYLTNILESLGFREKLGYNGEGKLIDVDEYISIDVEFSSGQ